MQNIIQKFRHFNELVMFEHTIFSASFILVAMICASLQANNCAWFGFTTLLLCALALISARNFAMGFNRLMDRDIDIKNPRTAKRPSVDGRLSFFAMSIFCIINAALFIITAYFINPLAFALSLPFLAILGVYSVMKRFSFLAHIVLGVAMSLAPIAGCIAVLGSVELWCVALALGVVFWGAGFDLLYSLQDIDFDKAHNLHSIPSKFGAKNTLLISRAFHILAVGFWVAFAYLCENLSVISFAGVGVCALMLIYEQYLVHKDFLNIPKAFFATNGYLGFIFFAFILADGVVNYGL